MLQEEIRTTGAVVMGRHSYDMAEGDLTGYEYQVPIFVLTHRVPEMAIKGQNENLTVTFVTDGIDGPTDAAGAIVDDGTLERARRAGLDPAALLANNDSYQLFDALGDLIVTGRTGTNVGDLQVFLANRKL